MKKIIPYLLIVAALLAFVSCKPETKEPESFTVKFDLNGGTVSTTIEDQTVKNGDKAARPAENPKNASSKGFKFWSIDGETEYDFEAPVKKDLTIKAVYWTTAEVAQLNKEVYCLVNIVYPLTLNKKMYDGTEASKIYDITVDAEIVEKLLMLSLLSCKYNETTKEFDFFVTHDGKEYAMEDSNLDAVVDEFSVKENKSTKNADEEGVGTYKVKLENVKIKATFTYTEGTTWTETRETDFTIDAVVTETKIDETYYVTITSTTTANGTEYPVLKYDVYNGIYEYKGYNGSVAMF